MKVVIVTQNDALSIPANIAAVLEIPGVEVPLVASLNVPGTLENRKWYFWRGFGCWQSLRMARHLLPAMLLDRCDALFGYRLLSSKRSVKAVAMRHSIEYLETPSPNDRGFLERLRSIGPDLIVSFSAPSVFGAELLQIPRLGCINLHCSRLPSYAGLLPSFWVLFHRERCTGATVHFMDREIDNGEILGQVEVPIEEGMSMLDVIRTTKRCGGALMVQTIRELTAGTLRAPNQESRERRYYSWPTIGQMVEFRRRGGRFA